MIKIDFSILLKDKEEIKVCQTKCIDIWKAPFCFIARCDIRNIIQAVFLYFCADWPKLPSQGYLNGLGNMGNLGSKNKLQPNSLVDTDEKSSHPTLFILFNNKHVK